MQRLRRRPPVAAAITKTIMGPHVMSIPIITTRTVITITRMMPSPQPTTAA
jgi:hypothetical protein